MEIFHGSYNTVFFLYYDTINEDKMIGNKNFLNI